jgi:hypothetical protein
MYTLISRVEIVLGWAIGLAFLFCLKEVLRYKYFKFRDVLFPPVIVFKYRDLTQSTQGKTGKLYYFIWLLFIFYILTRLIRDIHEAFIVSDGLFRVSLCIIPILSVALILLVYLFSKERYI